MKGYLNSTLLFAFFLFNAAAVFGCVCDTSVTFTEASEESTAIFSGKYLGAEYRKGIVNESVETTFFPGDEKKT